MIRDARDVVVSQIEASRKKWGKSWAASDATEAATRWKKWVDAARKYREPADLYREIRYEDLVNDGVETMQKVYSFLGTPLPRGEVKAIYDQFSIEACRKDEMPASVLQLGEVAHLPARPTGDGFFRAGIAGGWRTALSDADRVSVETIAGELLAELGYDAEHETPAEDSEPVSQ